MTSRPVAGLILAAGSSTRMEAGFKLLLPLSGGVLIHAPVAAALAAALEPVVVVTGHRPGDVRRALEERFGGATPLRVVENPRYAEGQATSLARGVREVRTRTEAAAAAVLLGDEPGVAPGAVREAVAGWRGRASAGDAPPVLRVRYRDRPGHPVIFPRHVFPELETLSGDRGARGWLERNAGRVEEVAVDRDAPRDVDTAEDYRRVARGPDGS